MNMNNLKVLSEQEVADIVEATSEILEETGVKIDSKDVLEKLSKKGVTVDFEAGTVRFPGEIQKRCIESAPREIPVINRNGEHVFTIGNNSTNFASGHNAVFFDDFKTGEHRQFLLKDVKDYIAVSHHLDEVDMIGLPASPGDVPSASSLLYSLREALALSDKPVYFSTDSDIINRYAVKMVEAAVSPGALKNGAYMISQLSPTSPLFWEKGAVQGIVECAERGFPVSILPEPISGVSAPYSLAGLVTIHNAEALSGIMITQLINPGTPVIWGSSWTTFDMRQSVTLVGSVETTLCRIAGAQVAKYYGLPLHTTAPNSDNHTMDEQNSWEKTLSSFCAASSGNNLIVNMGMYACGLTISLEQLVLDAEITGQIKRLRQGIDASKDMIAGELIKNVGHRGSFIMEEHTLNLLKSEEYREPVIATRKSLDLWNEKGGKNAVELARDIVLELTARPLPEMSVEKYMEISSIISNCEKEL